MWYCRNFVIWCIWVDLLYVTIYFFTLIGAYKYGFKVGMLTAVLSPLVNSFLFGMPSVTILPAILVKSVLLALVAGYMADRFRKITIPALLGTVMAYQVVGTLIEWALVGDFYLAAQDFQLEFRACCSRFLVAMLC